MFREDKLKIRREVSYRVKTFIQSQLGFKTKIGCAGIGIPHHVAAVITLAEENDFDGEIVSVAWRNEQYEQNWDFRARKLVGEVEM